MKSTNERQEGKGKGGEQKVREQSRKRVTREEKSNQINCTIKERRD